MVHWVVHSREIMLTHVCIDFRNTGTVTFSGSGGLANFGLIRYNNTDEVIIDRDITLNYHGSTFGGNAMAYFSNIAVATGRR